MSRNDTYNTKQKDAILKIIKKQKKAFTIKDLYNLLKYETGLTTIYRLVDKLIAEGYISKHIGKDNITYYQYLEKCDNENHFYLKCDECGMITHVDCDCIDELSSHIIKDHKFKLSKENIMINGLCDNCCNGR